MMHWTWLSSLLSCGGGSDLDSADLGVCEGEPTRTHVVTELVFARVEDGVTRGFDLDGYLTESGDDEGCGVQDMIDETGRTGIDNAFANLIPALELTEAKALEDIIQEAINTGLIVMMIEVTGLDETWEEDSCAELNLARGEGEPYLDPEGRILSGLTWDRDLSFPSSTVSGVPVSSGYLEGGPVEFKLTARVLSLDMELDVYQGMLGIQMYDDGSAEGLLSGAFSVDYLLEVAALENIADEVYELLSGLLGAAADMDLDGDGSCEMISATLQFKAVSAWFYPEE